MTANGKPVSPRIAEELERIEEALEEIPGCARIIADANADDPG